MISSGLCFLIVNLFVKILGTNNVISESLDLQLYGAHELVFFRSLVSFTICVWIIRKRKVPFWGNNKKWLLIRGFAGVFALTIFFFTLQKLPLAVASIVQYLSPIFTVLLSIIFLKEKLIKWQWICILSAFMGVLLMGINRETEMGETISTFWMLMGILAAFGSAVAYFAIVKLKDSDDAIHVVLYFPMLAIPITGIWCLFDFVMPRGIEWSFLLIIGVFTQMAQVCMTKAFHTESASAIVPFQYLGAIYAFVIGLFMFDEHLNWTIYFSLLLIFSGVVGNALIRVKMKRNH